MQRQPCSSATVSVSCCTSHGMIDNDPRDHVCADKLSLVPILEHSDSEVYTISLPDCCPLWYLVSNFVMHIKLCKYTQWKLGSSKI
jgi:hypothetical protein